MISVQASTSSLPARQAFRFSFMDTTASAPSQPTPRPALGILLIICAVSGFACLDTSAKWLSGAVSPMQIAAVRYIGSLLFTLLLLRIWKTPRLVQTSRLKLQCIRSTCLVAATLCNFTALSHIPLTETTAINFSSPLMVSVLAVPFLAEKIGPRRIVAVVIGFIGVLIVTRPGGAGMHWADGLAFLAAVANAFYSITTRLLAGHDRPETTMIYTGLVGSLVLLPVLPFVWTTPVAWNVWAVLGLVGVISAVAHWLLILAHKHAPASMLAPFYYIQLIGAAVLGRILFGETPDRWTLLGGAIVIGSGLYVFYREQFRRREAARQAA